MEIPFWGKFSSRSQNFQLKLKFGTWTNSNMLNSMMLFSFFVFEWKYPFSTNLVQKIKIFTLSWNLVPTLIRACRIQWWCSFFSFWSEIIFWDKFSPNSKNYQLRLKYGTYTNSNMQNSMMLFTFFEWKCLFLANLVQKVKIISWSWNLVLALIQICWIQ